jgi:hypothetical protein
MRNGPGVERAFVCLAAIGVAKMNVRAGGLESLADGVVVGDDEGGRLMA